MKKFCFLFIVVALCTYFNYYTLKFFGLKWRNDLLILSMISSSYTAYICITKSWFKESKLGKFILNKTT